MKVTDHINKYALNRIKFSYFSPILGSRSLVLLFITLLALLIIPLHAADSDGDGISDELDQQVDVMSGLVVILVETDVPLTYVGSYSTDYPNIVFNNQKKEGDYGKLEVLPDGRFDYTANKAHDDLQVGAKRDEIFAFTSTTGFKFQFMVSIQGTNDPAVISKLEYRLLVGFLI